MHHVVASLSNSRAKMNEIGVCGTKFADVYARTNQWQPLNGSLHLAVIDSEPGQT